MIMPLISPIIWLINTHSFYHQNGPKAIAPFAKKNTNCHIPILKFFIISILKFSNDTITNKKEQMPPRLLSLLMCRFESRLQPIKIKVFLLLELCPSNRNHQCTFIFTNFLVRMLQYLQKKFDLIVHIFFEGDAFTPYRTSSRLEILQCPGQSYQWSGSAQQKAHSTSQGINSLQ